ncbi:hypothetical protein [Desulfonauticus submarinus]
MVKNNLDLDIPVQNMTSEDVLYSKTINKNTSQDSEQKKYFNKKEWNISSPKRYKQFVLNITGKHFLFSKDNIFTKVDIVKYPQHIYYIEDYYDSTLGVIKVTGLSKYAKILAQKQLQEKGELHEDQTVHFFSQYKVGKNQNFLFYEILPKNLHLQNLDLATKTQEGFVYFDTVCLLYGLLSQNKTKKPKAIILRGDGYLTLIVGYKKKVLFAQKYPLENISAHAINETFNDCVRELKDINSQIDTIEWIEELSESPTSPEVTSEDNITIVKWPLAKLTGDNGKTYWSSLPFVVQTISPNVCFGPKQELPILFLEKIEKWILLALLIISFSFIGASYFLYQNTKDLQKSNTALKNYLSILTEKMQKKKFFQTLNQLKTQHLEDTVKFSKKLEKAIISPNILTLWNSIAKIIPENFQLNKLNVDYNNANQTDILLEGIIDSDISTVQASFSKFLIKLEQNGYTIKEKNIELDLDKSYFRLLITKDL